MRRHRRPTVSNDRKVNHDRWLVSYADFITLLFGFFVVMYSVSQVNESKYRELSETLGAAFKPRSGTQTAAAAPTKPDVVGIAELSQRVRHTLGDRVESREVNVQATDDWVEISVNANLLFNSGSAVPSEEAQQIFTQVAELLAPYESAVEVSGHTDNQPIRNGTFKNNWELSAARATSVVQLLSQQGVAPERLAATGYGEFRPLADNSTEAGRAANRRVVLLVARHQAERSRVEAQNLPATLEAEGEASESSVSAPEANTGERGRVSRPDAGIDRPAPGDAMPRAAAPLKPIIREDGSLLFTTDPNAHK